jgi:two-component system, LuxR family, sensor kinase FixL
MSWITIAWSMGASACLTLAMMHLVIWCKQHDQWAHLLFSMIAISVAALAAVELLIMRASSPEQVGKIIWWAHIPVFFGTVSIVGFVWLYFNAGRLWLGYTICGLRLLDLIINFFSVPNTNYKEITGLRHLRIFGGETISAVVGVENPWIRVHELSSLLLLVFVVDASVTLWRRRHPGERRRAVIVGGSMTFFILVAAGTSAFIEAGVFQSPYLISFSFLAIVAAMGYELSSDVVGAVKLARQLQASQAESRASEARFRLAVEAAPNAIIIINAAGKIELANAQVETVFGYTRQELVGQPVEMLVPERFRSQHPEYRRIYQADAKARAMGAGREL